MKSSMGLPPSNFKKLSQVILMDCQVWELLEEKLILYRLFLLEAPAFGRFCYYIGSLKPSYVLCIIVFT